MSPRRSEIMKVEPSRTWTGSCRAFGGSWPPGRSRASAIASGRPAIQVGEAALGLVDERLVADRPRLVAGLDQESPSLFDSRRCLRVGRVLQPFVRLDDELEDLAGLHVVSSLVARGRPSLRQRTIRGPRCPPLDSGQIAAAGRGGGAMDEDLGPGL